MTLPNMYLALVHHPIRNKNGEKVTTSVTNLDIHDIARTCRTFGVKQYFIVTPLEAQQELVLRILGHWETDKASAYNPDRQDALGIVSLRNSIEDAVEQVRQIEGLEPELIVTGANFKQSNGDEAQLIERLVSTNRPGLILFGTGWGLHDEVLQKAHYFLSPILGNSHDNYNHLSVRSAVAIYLSKIMQ
ncbi:MAG: RNA methyltransferase [Halobacteriovoraceae bacterium]|nr:RNA methyltransferase [Halobacteriovoraceae bacterium]